MEKEKDDKHEHDKDQVTGIKIDLKKNLSKISEESSQLGT
jgi:hypothetical protein